MSLNGASLNRRFRLLLRGCKEVRSLAATECFHALVITVGSCSSQPVFLYNNIVALYAAAGELPAARKVFDRMADRNTVSYNTLIVNYGRHGDAEEATGLFSAMLGLGFKPTQHSVAGLLSAPSVGIRLGLQLQAMVMKNGVFYADAYVGNALLNLYGKNGYLDEALGVFEDMPCKSTVTWNSMITLVGMCGFSELCGYLFSEVKRNGDPLSEGTIVGVLSGCIHGEELTWGEQIHGLVLKNAFLHETSVVNSLVSMYAKCADPCLAEKLFVELQAQDVVSWNIVIGAWAKIKPGRSLVLFYRMSVDGVLPNRTTFATIVNSCIGVDLRTGEFVHTKIIKNGYSSDVYSGTALVDFYLKYEKLDESLRCFDEICDKTVVSWNALLSGYARTQSNNTPLLFCKMVKAGYQPNELTFSATLKAMSSSEIQQLHSMLIKLGYGCYDHVLSSLITSYARQGLISDALSFLLAFDEELAVVPTNSIAGICNREGQYLEAVKLLSRLEQPDLISWNIVISACARSYNYTEVFELFKHMHLIRIQPDKYTFVSLLAVCSKYCNLALGSSIHCLMIKVNINQFDTITCNILMDMYGKCGNIGSLMKVFESMTDKNIITWTVLISALGVNGFPLEAVERFRAMDLLEIKPDGILFGAVLTACRHGRLVSEGMELFQLMKTSYGVEPEMDHYQCMVNLLTQSGYVEEAEKMIANMPFPPSAALWRSFLEGCKRGSNENGALMIEKDASI